jgi:hypothetical protein
VTRRVSQRLFWQHALLHWSSSTAAVAVVIVVAAAAIAAVIAIAALTVQLKECQQHGVRWRCSTGRSEHGCCRRLLLCTASANASNTIAHAIHIFASGVAAQLRCCVWCFVTASVVASCTVC